MYEYTENTENTENTEEIKRLTDLHNKAYEEYKENNHLIEDEYGNEQKKNVCFFCGPNFENEHNYSVIQHADLMNTLLDLKSMYADIDHTTVNLKNKYVYLLILSNNTDIDDKLDRLALYLLHMKIDKTVYVFEDKKDFDHVLKFLKN